MIEWLQGKKTYITIIAGFILNGLIVLGVLPESAFLTVNSILAFVGLGFLRLSGSPGISLLGGWRTYAVAIVGVILNGLVALGYMPAEWLIAIDTILGYLGLGFLRSGK